MVLALLVVFVGCGDDGGGPEDTGPTIFMTAPHGGEAVTPGGTIDIRWVATDDDSVVGVDLSYTADNVTETSIATDLTGSEYTWTVPNTNTYGIRIKAVAKDAAGQTDSDVTDDIFAVVAASPRGYVTSDACQDCHSAKYEDLFESGHPYKLNKVVGGVAPTYPFTTVANPPTGFTWDDITYVIGGYAWKARFMNDSGWIITDGIDGVNAQYNLARSDLAGGLPEEWVAYHATDTERKPYTCGTCHTTGWQTTAENGGVNQDGLPGIYGTWEEPGVRCEQCHGAGLNHVVTQSADNIDIDQSSELCGSCHFRDTNHNILASGGFIRHHEQYDELISAKHSARACIDCHEPHIGVKHGNAAAGGMTASCVDCHSGKTQNSHVVQLDCETCHMARATKSARKVNEHQGDLRTHIFKINPNPFPKDSMFFVDAGSGATHTRGFVTLDFVCYQCHKDGNGVGGANSTRTLAELSSRATGIHN
jgi:hypothetical protein